MKHITVLSDYTYLIFGVTLVRSLNRTSSIPITIHYFCIDDKSFSALTRMELANVIPYPPATLFHPGNAQLLHLKQTNFQYLCWSLASVFTHYIFHHTECDSVTYIDSDILFHLDIQLLFDQFAEKDCGIFKHRFLKDGEDSPYGRYNVGVVYFKKSEKGATVLNWWADSVLYRKHPPLATCGDQKYLDLFPTICGSGNIYIDNNVAHGAPWNWHVYDCSLLPGNITWRGQIQPLVFTHFSKFVYDLEKNTFQCTDVNIYSPYTNGNKIYAFPPLYEIHRGYFEELKVSSTSIRNVS